MYKLKTEVVDGAEHHVQLLGSGAILNSSLTAQQLLAEKFGISSTVWSVTSYTELARDAQAIARFNRLHPTKKSKTSYLENLIADIEGPFISSSDYVRAVSEQISPWIQADSTRWEPMEWEEVKRGKHSAGILRWTLKVL